MSEISKDKMHEVNDLIDKARHIVHQAYVEANADNSISERDEADLREIWNKLEAARPSFRLI